MSQANFRTTPGGTQPPLRLERFDLDAHPDGVLMRLCLQLERLRGQLEALERAIAAIPAVTTEGRRLKALTL
jgi:transposase